MITARLSYNGKNIDFPLAPYRFDPPDYPRRTSDVMGGSGNCQTLLGNSDAVISIGFRRFVNATAAHLTLRRNLAQWLQWAQAGYPWTFARDLNKVANTTLNGAVLAGASSLIVTSATGLTVGEQYILRSTDTIELVKISGIASTTISLTESLNFGYASGSRFRAELFWPGRLLDKRNPFVEQRWLHWGFELNFQEDVNSL